LDDKKLELVEIRQEAIFQVASAFNIPDKRCDDLAKVIEDFAAGKIVVTARTESAAETATPQAQQTVDVASEVAAESDSEAAAAPAGTATTAPRPDDTATETTKRRPRAKPRPDWIGARKTAPRVTAVEPCLPAAAPAENLSPAQVAAVIEDSTLGRLQARYEKRLREIVLPKGGFTTKAEANAAGRLSKTLRDLQKIQRKLRLPVTVIPERVREAERLRTDYETHHTKTGEVIPRRPRGRPRRHAAEEAELSAR
jgi:hypothetical protein